MIPKDTYLKHQALIANIALYKFAPQNDNTDVKEIIEAWKTELKNIKSKVIVGECGSCAGGWLGAIKDFYVYAKNGGWI